MKYRIEHIYYPEYKLERKDIYDKEFESSIEILLWSFDKVRSEGKGNGVIKIIRLCSYAEGTDTLEFEIKVSTSHFIEQQGGDAKR